MQKNFGIGLCNNIAHCLLCALACRTDSYLLNKSMKIFLCFIVYLLRSSYLVVEVNY